MIPLDQNKAKNPNLFDTVLFSNFMFINAKKNSYFLTSSNKRIFSGFCLLKRGGFVCLFFLDFHQNPWLLFSFLLSLYFTLGLSSLIRCYYAFLSTYPTLLWLSVTLLLRWFFTVLITMQPHSTSLSRLKLLWSWHWDWYSVHHAHHLELTPSNLPEKVGYHEWNLTFSHYYLYLMQK